MCLMFEVTVKWWICRSSGVEWWRGKPWTGQQSATGPTQKLSVENYTFCVERTFLDRCFFTKKKKKSGKLVKQVSGTATQNEIKKSASVNQQTWEHKVRVIPTIIQSKLTLQVKSVKKYTLWSFNTLHCSSKQWVRSHPVTILNLQFSKGAGFWLVEESRSRSQLMENMWTDSLTTFCL